MSEMREAFLQKCFPGIAKVVICSVKYEYKRVCVNKNIFVRSKPKFPRQAWGSASRFGAELGWEEALQSVVLPVHHEEAVTCSFVFGVYTNRVVLPVQVVLEETKREPWFLFVSPRAGEEDRLLLWDAWGELRGAPLEE